MSDSPRTSTLTRSTNETEIVAKINLDGSGASQISTGLGFFDHMLDALARHSGMDIELSCNGDLRVDDHHTIEDCALVLGKLIDDALGDRVGITRFASAYAPLDESLARVVVDLSGRPSAIVELGFTREMIGSVATENITHFFESLAVGMRGTLHVDLIRGRNDHHKAEAGFKALALAMRDAVRITRGDSIPSTKGTLS
ncbi:MAG: imidazoleglycerol-phosphate dehydratase HisB [Phycisphaerales bacterium]|nr:imidazoleglycerol-phosphate dehydratase HisB [Phycisphaerales bacterium]